MNERKSILLLTRPLPLRNDGVGQYTALLADALTQRGYAARVCREIARWGWRGLIQVVCACRQGRVGTLILQFSPFGYGRWGVCLYLAGWLAAARWLGRVRVAVTFHELYNDWGRGPLAVGVSLVHRVQFFLVGALAHELVFTTAPRADRGRRWFFWKPNHVHRVPVGSNIPVAGEPPDRRDGVPVISTFGLLQRAVCVEELLRAVAALVHEDGCEVTLQVLGDWSAGEPRRKQQLEELVATLKLQERVQWTGPLPAAEISRQLLATDLYVCWRRDGPSTRSGTLAAALAHGVPVVANRAPGLDPAFAGGQAVRLFDDDQDLRRQCRELLRDPAQRAELGRHGREFYLMTLTWDRIAERYADIVSRGRLPQSCCRQIVLSSESLKRSSP